jgi:hypothetical protein
MTLDTADLVRDKRTGELWYVACAHDVVAYLCQPGAGIVRIEYLQLESRATPEQRQEWLQALAGSSGTGHRPRCARARLQAAAGTDG